MEGGMDGKRDGGIMSSLPIPVSVCCDESEGRKRMLDGCFYWRGIFLLGK